VYDLRDRNIFENSEITNAFINTLRFHQTMFMISDSTRNSLNNLFEDKFEYKLFYRVDFPFCESCVYPTIEKLSAMSSKFGIENIIILTAFPSDDFLEDFIDSIKNNNIKILNIPDWEFCFNTRDFIGSYLFLMNSNFEHQYLFFVSQHNQFMIQSYLEFVAMN